MASIVACLLATTYLLSIGPIAAIMCLCYVQELPKPLGDAWLAYGAPCVYFYNTDLGRWILGPYNELWISTST